MAEKKGKSSNLIPFAIIGIASVVVVGGMIAVTANKQSGNQQAEATQGQATSTSNNASFGTMASEDSATRSFEAESEQRLEELRNQEKELETVYEGTEETVYQGEADDPVLMDGSSGQFSDFDAPPEPAKSSAPETEAQSDAPQSESDEAEEPSSDEVLTQTLMDTQAAPAPSIAEPRIEAIEDRLAGLSDEMDQLAGAQAGGSALSESSLSPIREDIETLGEQFRMLADRVDEMGESSSAAGEGAKQVAELRQQFDAFSQRMDQRFEALDDRLDEVSAQAQQAPAKPSPEPTPAPQRPAVEGLYELMSIESGVVVLEGQNTGRMYRIAEGGDLAYGGRLLDIDGDEAVLAWPHRTITLSVYGP